MEKNQRIRLIIQNADRGRRSLARGVKKGWLVVEKYTNFSKPEAWLTTFSSLLLRLGAILLITGLVIFLWRMLHYEGYNIQQFSVPKTLDENGFNGTVVARKLEDHYLHLKSVVASVKEDSVQAIGDEQQPELNVDVLGVGISLRSIGFHLRDLFGRKNNFIRGEVTQTEQDLALTLRMSGTEPETIFESLENGQRHAIGQLLEKAAEQILKKTDPYRLAIYYDHIGKHEEGIETAHRMLQDRPSEEHWAYLAWGVNLESLSRYDEALVKFEQSIEANPDFPLAWLRKGYILRIQGYNEEAVEYFKKVVELRSDNSSYWNSYGLALYFSGRLEEADQAYQKAAENSKGTINWLINWAEKKAAQGKMDEAEKIVDQAIEKAEQQNNVIEEMDARLFKALLQTDTLALNRYADIKLASVDNIFDIGLITTAYFRTKNYQKTIRVGKLSEQVENLDNQRQRILNMVAMSFNFIGKPDSGLVYVQKSIMSDTTSGYPYSTLAETYHYLGDQEMFYQTLEKAFLKDFSPNFLNPEDKPYDLYWQEPRFQELLSRFDPEKLKD